MLSRVHLIAEFAGSKAEQRFEAEASGGVGSNSYAGHTLIGQSTELDEFGRQVEEEQD